MIQIHNNRLSSVRFSNANLEGTIKNNESILSNFISSQGLLTSLISSSLSTDRAIRQAQREILGYD